MQLIQGSAMLNFFKVTVTVIVFSFIFSLHAVATTHKHNVLGLFLGATTHHETHFTYGAEYQRAINKNTGVMFVLEHTPSAEEGDVVGTVLLTYKPIEALVLGIGGGFKSIIDDKSHGLGRLYAGLILPTANHMEIVPDVSADFVEGNIEAVYGVSITKVF